MNCRSGPGTSYDVVKSYKKDEDIKIVCQASGTDVKGDKLWDKTADNCYVTDYYVKTGTTSYVADKCDGSGGDSGGSGGGSSSGDGGSIVDAAEKEKGLPYVWGGGNYNGPSGGGFDCSGLTQYALYQSLHKKIPRTAQTQYDATSIGKRVPRSQAKEGDLLFWAEGGNCKSGVSHVGIYIKKNLMINAAHTGTPVREQSIWTEYGGEKICDEVMRYVFFPFLLDLGMLLTCADSGRVSHEWAFGSICGGLLLFLYSFCTFKPKFSE